MTPFLLAAWMQSDSEAGTSFDTILLLFGIVVFVVLAPRLIRMGRNRSAPCPEPQPEIRRERHDPSSIRVRETVDRALVELVDTSREISAQIDNRIRMLNKLVRDADEERTRLESILAEIRAERDGGSIEKETGRDGRGALALDPSQGQASSLSVDVADPPEGGAPGDTPRNGSGDRVGESPEDLSGADAGQDAPTVTAAGARSAMNQAYARIATLAAEGRTSSEIARSMRLSTAEVNLVLHILESKKG